MKICITGGGGYVGTRLVPYLIDRGHDVTVLDTWWYGDYIPSDPNLTKILGDIRNPRNLRAAFYNQDVVIHMACVSNDPSFDMNPDIGKQINYGAFANIINLVREQKVKRFIYASSSSVYGVSDEKNITEESTKHPLTDYSKFKLLCEMDLAAAHLTCPWTILRPATVCGYSPRMRFDLVVNALTINALVNKRIILFGRDQKRPNININDMVRAYDFIINADEDVINKQTFNVGQDNYTLREIAERVRHTLGDKSIEIVEEPNNDPRSYHVNSDKIKKAGFEFKHSLTDAVREIKNAYAHERFKEPLANPYYFNIKRMKEIPLRESSI